MLNNRAGMEHFFPSIFNRAHFIRVMDRFFAESKTRIFFVIIHSDIYEGVVDGSFRSKPTSVVFGIQFHQRPEWCLAKKTFASVNFEKSMSYDYKTPSWIPQSPCMYSWMIWGCEMFLFWSICCPSIALYNAYLSTSGLITQFKMYCIFSAMYSF